MAKVVLVVDDSATVRQGLRTLLQGAGYEVLEACDGQEGLDQIAAHRPALVLCDVNMPRLDGLGLLAGLGGRVAAMPVVMLTTEGQPSLVRKARDAGARGWIVKPPAPAQLLEVVRRMMP